MSELRPDPDELLRKIEKQNLRTNYGKLKIFFGYAAGVGKTYAMLEAARCAKAAGIDMLVGYIEPHTRPETNELLVGLDILPSVVINHKGIKLKEFDIDEALRRHPTLVLVDELAHTNAPGSRNLKRYQDIDELLRAGIDVYTTVNVQHIESLNDIVYQITKIAVNERIPDKVLDNADKIELVDVEPDELILRLNEGKIYANEQSKRALENFFTPKNLDALREIALRRIADQINKRNEQDDLEEKQEFYTNEHILICLSSSPSNAKVIRTASRMSSAFHGYFTALFVETTESTELSGESMTRLRANLKLAQQLGAKIETVYGDNISEQIAEYAKANEVSKIVIGRSNNKKSFIPKPTFVEKLTQMAPNVDIYIIPDSFKPYSGVKHTKKTQKTFSELNGRDTIISLAILFLCTVIGFIFFHFGFNEANVIMVYILGVIVTAVSTKGKMYSMVSSVLSVLVFNYFFTEPYFSLNAYDGGYPVTFLIMLIVAMMSSNLATRVKSQAYRETLKAQNTHILLETSQLLQKAADVEQIYNIIGNRLIKLSKSAVTIYPVNNKALLNQPIIFLADAQENKEQYLTLQEYAVADWVLKNNKQAGATTNTLSGAKCLYMAVRGKDEIMAVVGIAADKDSLGEYEKNLLVAMMGEFGLSLENEHMNQSKKELYAKAKQEQLRSNLLRAISHDLRTPLTSISGNSNILMANESVLNPEKRQQLYTDIYDDSMWLINLVENLLSVTRIDNSNMDIKMQPEMIEDVIAEALRHVNRRSIEHKITTELEDDLLIAIMDASLIIQVIINLVNNAIKYTPAGTAITVKAKRYEGNKIAIEIADTGDGINDEDKSKIFEMFYTAGKNFADSRRGLGLGLSLCKSIIVSHGGEIWVGDHLPKGTVFTFTLKAKEAAEFELL